MSNTKEFYKQFSRPEFYSISGKYFKNLIIVCLIFIISILVIGFAQGVGKYLEKKMKDPFISFVHLKIPSQLARSLDIDTLNSDTLKRKFNYSNTEIIYFQYLEVSLKEGEPGNSGKGRKISVASEFYKYIIESEEIFLSDKTKNDFADNEYGIIVTEEFLQENYKLDNIDDLEYLFLVKTFRGEDYYIPVKICGIVSKLPAYTDFLLSDKLYYALKNPETIDVTVDEHLTYLMFYSEAQNDTDINKEIEELGYSLDEDSYFGKNLKGKVYVKDGLHDFESEYSQVKSIAGTFIRLYDFDRAFSISDEYISSPDMIAFQFNSLDSVQSFDKYLRSIEKELTLDMTTIESTKNFNIFNKISIILSFTLIIFSVIVVIIFVTNVTLSHIEKNKKNLGTLKAFGLSNSFIVFIYSSISSIMVIIAFIIAYLLCMITGNLFVNQISALINLDISTKISFEIIPIWMSLMFFILLPSIIIYIRIRLALRGSTPGDLIYERI